MDSPVLDSPLQTNVAVMAIAAFAQEMFPVVRDLQGLAVDVCALRIGFFSSFYSRKLNALNHEYVDLLGNFMRVYRKWADPNELFKDVDVKDPRGAAQLMNDYTRMRGALREHLEEGFRLLAYIDNVLRDRKTIAYNRLTMFIAALAIVISVLVAV